MIFLQKSLSKGIYTIFITKKPIISVLDRFFQKDLSPSFFQIGGFFEFPSLCDNKAIRILAA
jgi:hypothetical protein